MKGGALIGFVLAGVAAAAEFRVEPMPNPPGVDPQVGGLDVFADGRIAAVFHRGEVMVFDPATRAWSKFAEGLHEPLGVVVESPRSLLVMQRPELTRLVDEDGDGSADLYETVCDDFGMTGNYHEFAFGPVRGPDGALYVALNLASNGAGVAPEIRGEWSEIGTMDRAAMTFDETWDKRRDGAGRMYSRVPWRGWVLRISPAGEMEPFASGFRSPDGLGFDARGRLLVTDNQGDWRGTSPLYVVERGGFYGHPASLVWRDDWDGRDPVKMPKAELERLREPESARFPQGELANSPTQPILVPEGWGPLTGDVLIGEMNQPHLVRFLADEVAGFPQGSLVSTMASAPIGNGVHRLAFDETGSLWLGKTHLSWAGGEGLLKVDLIDPASLFVIDEVRLEKREGGEGFRVRFSQPVAEGVAVPEVRSYDFAYHDDYGSPKIDERAVQLREVQWSADRREVWLGLEVRAGFVHELRFDGLKDESGAALDGARAFYQATRVPE